MGFREEVWTKIEQRYPAFTHAHDSFDDPWAIDCLILGDSIGYVPSPGERVMDVGANVGIWSAFCALGGCSVVSYEADPITFGVLTAMLHRTGLNVTAINSAVYSYTGVCAFHGEYGADRARLRNGAIQTETSIGKPIQIPCVSFQDALGTQEWDFVKMDVEGAEFAILLATPVKSLRQIKAMQIEFHNLCSSRRTYNRTLKKLGTLFTFDGPTEVDASLPYYKRLHWAKFKRK
jgi:FkbM family methyltransferase